MHHSDTKAVRERKEEMLLQYFPLSFNSTCPPEEHIASRTLQLQFAEVLPKKGPTVHTFQYLSIYWYDL